jgi:hypothetical protein
MNASHTVAHDQMPPPLSRSAQEPGTQNPAGVAEHAQPATVAGTRPAPIRALDALAQCMVDSALGG